MFTTDKAPDRLQRMVDRVLVVHNRYQIRGGEDAVVDREVEALRRSGVMVETLFFDNHAIRTRWDRLRTAIQAAEAPAGVSAVLRAVTRLRPDVVHVHNTFPLISPAVHAAVRRESGAATVQTLHNYRITCANAQLFRDGVPCEDCITGSPYNAVLHGCYRGSRLGSLAVARMIDRSRQERTWTTKVDRFIALTQFAKQRFARAGVPDHLIRVKPNGLADPGGLAMLARGGLVYVGRLSAEKGVTTLAGVAGAVGGGSGVTFIGEGPLRNEIATRPGASVVGRGSPEQVFEAMASARAVVVPSLWYEGLPMVITEAFAVGTPVIASRIGGLAEVIEDGVTGLLVRPGDPDALSRACQWITNHPAEAERMGCAARAVFETRWAEAVTTRQLLAIYDEAILSRRECEELP